MTERSIFLEALEIADPTERLAYLDQACAGDAAVQRQVESLLAAHERPGSFLDRPAVALAGTGAYFLDPAQDLAVEAPPEDRESQTTGRAGAGVRIGPYQLVQEIGAGGMGTVYLAQQTTPVKRLVALKVIKLGMDSRQVIARFEAERQALALMDHPNIAKVLDGGTTDTGRPFFVMELVKGVPITQYSDEHQLTLRQRLELFVPVCQAVQHAHHKGIIHRDLKPSNVLVACYDGQPVPKVIDFGVAKAAGQPLTDRTLVTGLGTVVGTLEYMSPEQAKGSQQDIDTRSDIYSQGVLLYELLTGTTPLERKRVKAAGLLEALRIIREEETPKPSTRLSTAAELPRIAANRGQEPRKLSGLVRGELDWIVMKCLEKDRNRRYDTANDLARDLERYLHDEPVQACPPSTGYRLRKYARRNKGAVATGLLLGVMLLVALGAVGGSIGWVMRNREARQAKLADDMQLAMERAEWLQEHGKPVEALAAFERAALLAAEATLDPAVRQRLTDLKERLDAEAQDQDFVARFEEIRLLEQTRMNDKEVRYTFEEANPRIREILHQYGIEVGVAKPDQSVARIQGRPKAIQGSLLAALQECLLYTPTEDEQTRKWLNAVLNAADTDPWRVQVRLTETARDWQAMTRLAREVDVPKQPPSFLLWVAKSLPPEMREAHLDLLRRIQQTYPGDFWANVRLAYALKLGGQPAEAVRYYTAALAVSPHNPSVLLSRATALQQIREFEAGIADIRQVLAADPQHSSAHYNLGLALFRKGDVQGAITHYQRANAINPKGPKGHIHLGIALMATGDVDGAIVAYQTAIALDSKYVLAFSGLGDALLAKKDVAGARAAYQGAIDLNPQFVPHGPGDALLGKKDVEGAIVAYQLAVALQPECAQAHNSLGKALDAKGDLAGAIAAFQKAIALKPDLTEAHTNLANALQANGDLTGAVATRAKAGALKPDLAVHHNNLGIALCDKGDLSGGIAAYQKAIALKPDYAAAHNNLGIALRANGDLPGASAACRQAIALHEQQVQQSPTASDPHSGLGGALNNLALVLQDQGQLAGARRLLERAIGHQQTALKVQPKNPTYRQFLRNHHMNLTETLVRLGEHGEAARAAAELPRTYPDGWPEYLRAAAFLARCVPLAEKDAQLPPDQRAVLAQGYGAEAVAMLQHAVAKGYKDAGGLRRDPALAAPLQSRADFKRLLTELEARTNSGKEEQSAKP